MITRSAGLTTGTGYLVGGGYTGKTSELDSVVSKIAVLLQATFLKDVEIRFNTHRESGGAFIKDDDFSYKIGIGAGLSRSQYESLTKTEQMAISFEDMMKMPKDIIVYHIVVDDSLGNGLQKKYKYYNFKRLKNALNCLSRSLVADAAQEYLNGIASLAESQKRGGLDYAK